jgi:hypothetical protein
MAHENLRADSMQCDPSALLSLLFRSSGNLLARPPPFVLADRKIVNAFESKGRPDRARHLLLLM